MVTRMLTSLACAGVVLAAAHAAMADTGASREAGASQAAGLRCLRASRALAASTAGSDPGSYDDFIEDAGDAPDFCGSNLVTNDNETIRFRLHVHNRDGFVAGDEYRIMIDADSNPTTGRSGVDHVVLFGSGETYLTRWNGSSFDRVETSQSSLTSRWVIGTGPEIVLERRELGAPRRLGFVFASSRGADADLAPDTGVWSYELRPLSLRVTSFTRGAARAGKPFSVRMAVIRRDLGVKLIEGAISCRANVAGKRLSGVGRFAGRRAVCTWRLPTRARGKRLAGSIAVTFQGVRARRSFSVAIK